jgi:hypothetical protein
MTLSQTFPDFPNNQQYSTVKDLEQEIKEAEQVAKDLYDDRLAEGLAKLNNLHILEEKLAYWKQIKINEEMYEVFKDKVRPEVAEIVDTLVSDRVPFDAYQLFLTAELLATQ